MKWGADVELDGHSPATLFGQPDRPLDRSRVTRHDNLSGSIQVGWNHDLTIR